jgi:diadenosine tetraphosphate (Ap4A) HIT family hydrolase
MKMIISLPLDITQVTKGHTFVVPKKHYRNMLDMDAEAAATSFQSFLLSPVI